MKSFKPNINATFRKFTQNKNFSTVLMAGLIVLFLVDIFFVFVPEIRTINKVNTEISSFRQKIILEKNEVTNLDKFKETLQNKMEEVGLKENSFVSEEDLSLLIEEISKAASEAKMEIGQIKPVREANLSKAQKGEEVFISVPILVQATSDYHSLGKFINKIERADNFFSINELEILANSTDYKKSNVLMNITTILKIKKKP